MATTTPLVNAWIFLNEDEPVVNGQPVGYNDPLSCYQTLIQNNVYQAVDILNLSFVTTLPTSASTIPTGDGSSYTIEMGAISPPHPGGLTNQDYMNNIIRDSRANNPEIKLAVTLNWGDANVLSNIFLNTNVTPQQNAENFAANLTAYLNAMGLDGFDIDWESPISGSITTEQFALLSDAIRASFDTVTDRHLYLTLSPAEVGNLDADAVNRDYDFVNLQLYSGFTDPGEFTSIGVDQALLAYGAKFESNFQTAQEAYDGYVAGGYKQITQWRLNSDNFEFEQNSQKELYRLVFPTAAKATN
jgi:hypothetical protein